MKTKLILAVILIIAFVSMPGCNYVKKQLGMNTSDKQQDIKTEQYNSTVDSKKQVSQKDVSQLTDLQAMEVVKAMDTAAITALVKWSPEKRTWEFDPIIPQLIGKWDDQTDKNYQYDPNLPIAAAQGEDKGSGELMGNAHFGSNYKMGPSDYPKWFLKKDESTGALTYTYPEGASLLEIALIQFDTDPQGYCKPESRRWAKIGDCVIKKNPGSSRGWHPWWLVTKNNRLTLRAPGLIKEHGAGTWTAAEMRTDD